jgi:predicted ATPase
VKVKNLRIEKLPGIRPGFSLNEIDPGVNLVVGPNASGKSSLCRAVRALLYAEEQPDSFLHLEAEVEDEHGTARVIRIGRDIRWEREGQTIEPRLLPEHRFLSCYTLLLLHPRN